MTYASVNLEQFQYFFMAISWHFHISASLTYRYCVSQRQQHNLFAGGGKMYILVLWIDYLNIFALAGVFSVTSNTVWIWMKENAQNNLSLCMDKVYPVIQCQTVWVIPNLQSNDAGIGSNPPQPCIDFFWMDRRLENSRHGKSAYDWSSSCSRCGTITCECMHEWIPLLPSYRAIETSTVKWWMLTFSPL